MVFLGANRATRFQRHSNDGAAVWWAVSREVMARPSPHDPGLVRARPTWLIADWRVDPKAKDQIPDISATANRGRRVSARISVLANPLRVTSDVAMGGSNGVISAPQTALASTYAALHDAARRQKRRTALTEGVSVSEFTYGLSRGQTWGGRAAAAVFEAGLLGCAFVLPGWTVLPGLIPFAVMCWFFEARVFRVSVVAGAAGLVIRNPCRTYTLAWKDVDGVVALSDRTRVRLMSGKKILLYGLGPGFGGTTAQMVEGQRELEACLDAAREQARQNS